MALSVDIPKINITPEAEEDDDHIPLNLSEALTDVEDLDDDQEPPVIKKKSKLKIKLSNDNGGATDLEDFEASSEDEEIKIIKHDNPVLLSDLDLEAPITEESYKRQARRAKGKKRTKTEFATKQKSFYHSMSEEEKDEDEGVATNSEGYDTENDLNENSIPETDFNLDLYKSENYNVTSIPPSPTSDYSDNNGCSSVIAAPQFLQALRFDDAGATDCEILRSDSDSESDVKRTKVRRRKHRKPAATTDLEDLYFSDDEAASKSVRRQKRKPPQLLAKSNTLPFESENEDNATLPFPVCKQIAKKHPVALRLPEFDTNFQTDVEDIEGDPDLESVETRLVNEAALEEKLKEISSYYGKVREEHKCVQKEYSYASRVGSVEALMQTAETDEDEFQSEGVEEIEMFSRDENISYKIKFSPSYNSLKDNNLSLPLNTDDPLTDWENVDSSPEEVASKKIPLALVEGAHGFTDEEEFSDNDNNDIDFNVSEIHLPPSTRNLVLIQENDALVPTVRILPLDSLEISHRESSNFGDTTDEEIVSEAEEALDLLNVDEPVRAPTPDLPYMDGGQVNVQEHINTMRNSYSPLLIDSLTDTEDLILDNKPKRKRAPKFKFMYEKSLTAKNDRKNLLTDTEDVVFSDGGNQNCLSIPLLTDTENIDFSGDDQDYSLRPLSVTPQHMRELGGETLLLREGSGPFSIIDKLELNKFRLHEPNKFVTPATTDSEDMMASAEEDLDHPETATPNHVHQELEQMSASKVQSECGKKFDVDEEVMYLKGGGYTDPQSDIELLEGDGDVSEVENVAFDFENFSVAFGRKEWDASKKPAEVPGQTSLDESATQQENICGLTQAEPSLTTTDSSAPQPKPRTTKPDMPLDFSKTPPAAAAAPKTTTDKILSPVRDDLLDNDEEDLATYSDRKKFWENVSKEAAHKRMSLHEVSATDKELISKKRISIHEIGQPPVPKPRSTLTSHTEPDTTVKEKTVAELKIDKAIEAEKIHAQEELTSIIEGIESTDKPDKIMSEYQASFMAPAERKEKFKISEKSQQSSEIDKDESLDSDRAQKGSSQFIENAGYISDSEDVENVISDSEIEDRVPQIRERQMSVFAPPVTQRKTIYERSASLPTEDLYEVSRNLKHLKEKYEQKIKDDLIEEQFVADNEEESSPERKTLATLQEERISSFVDEAMSKITEEDSFEETSFKPVKTEESKKSVFEKQTIVEHDLAASPPIPHTHKESESDSQQKTFGSEPSLSPDQKYVMDESCVSMEVHVDKSEIEDSEKIAEESDFGSKSLDSIVSEPRAPSEDIPEITVTLSGTQRRISEESDEYSDKVEAAVVSPIPEESSIKQSEEHVQDTVWEATVETQSGFDEKVDVFAVKEQMKLTKEFIATEKIFEEKDQLVKYGDLDEMTSVEEDEASQLEHIIKKQSESEEFLPSTIKENISEKLTKEIHEKLNEKLKAQDIMIEKAVSEEVDDQTLDELKELMVEEALEELHHHKIETDKKSDIDDFSSGLREESDLGSEIHLDHSDSAASERIKSESHSEIEKIILDTFQHMKVDPEEAKRIAAQLIEEIENEIQNRGELSRSEATEQSMLMVDPEMSSYIKQLAETNGLDEREVELVESVLARRQRELAKLARGDTQASSMEITDEDLRYSGGEIDYTNTLEQQMGQLEAEKVHDLAREYNLIDHEKDFHEKSETFDKIDEKHKTEKVFSEDSETYEDSKIKISKKDVAMSIADHVKGEKSLSEHKNVILEEDETISESSVEEHSKIKTHIDSVMSEASLVKTDAFEIQESKTGVVTSDLSHKSDIDTELKEIKSDTMEQELKKATIDVEDAKKISGKYASDIISKEVTEDFSKEQRSSTEKEYEETQHKDEKLYTEELSKLEKLDDGTEVSTNIIIDRQRFESTSAVITKDTTKEKVVVIASKTLEGTDLQKLLEDRTTTETIHRTSSSDSKSSLDSGKSPDKKFETYSKEHVILRKTKSEVDSSSSSSNLKPDRRSGIEFEAYSSSGESHYQSFEMDSGKSRPCSSDVEGIVAAASSEYDTALTSTQEYSAKSHVTSTDYHTAISSLSSKESMKSLDSESSGNLASVEVSEHSETLVPSSSDLDGDILDSIDQQILEDAEPSSGWTGHSRPGRQVSDLTDSDLVNDSIDISEEEQNDKGVEIAPKMKRSAEMTFQPEPKILASDSLSHELDSKYGQSLDDGSILSMSVSSTSSTGAQRTVIEMSERHDTGFDDNEITMRGSQESLPLTPTLQKSYDMATSTPPMHPELPIEHVTITTTSVKEDGVHSASTQITSETSEMAESVGALRDEPRKKGHRRTESSMIGISLPALIPDLKLKEKEADESEKDIDEKEQSQKEEIFDNEDGLDTQSGFSKSDSDIERPDRVESELADIMKSSEVTEESDPIDRPTTPEPQDITKYESPEFSIEQEFSSKTKEVAMELHRKRSTSSISDISKDILEKRDSHGKSSSTSSEKSSFEEAEAEAAFSMVAHISPAHKVKQIIPILEDEDAEKRELEAREKQRKELEEKRAQMRDISPAFIPDITVTDMTPDSEHDETSKRDNFEDFEKIAEESILQQQPEETPQDRIEDDILTSSMMQSTLIDSVITESTTSAATVVDAAKTAESDADSHSSDSFEMLEKPDIIDDFVVIEEVGKEAQEFDTEGQSVKIDKSTKKVKKHDEEIERYLAHSAPTPLTGTTSSMDELGFEFEESPPRPEESGGGVASTRDYGFEYDKELEANKKWIEQQFQGDQAAMIAAGYGYEMEFERGPLEDIKEEDINDFAASSYGSQKESGGSLGSVKDSYSSTPDYDVLAGRKYFTRSGEQDDISMSSLQEFENLEQAMSLEMRKFHQGQGSGSSSSGSSRTRLHHGKNNTGDDISVSSLKEFEGLEHACIQAHKIEVKAKEEEAMLAQIEEGQESIASESESCETVDTEKKVTDTDEEEDYEKRMFEIDEIIKQAQSNVERFIDLKEIEKTESLGRGDSIEEVSKVPELELDTPVVKSTIKVQWKENEDVMIASTDSLDTKPSEEDRRDSADSLDAQPTGDIMTASIDSIELQASQKPTKDTIMSDSIEIRDEKSYMISSDSLELNQATSSGLNLIQTDSIEEDVSRLGAHDHSSASTGKDFSSSAREEPDMDPTSSTATHATMQYETDSIFSGSFTSGGSNTMVSSTDTIDPMHSTVDVGAAVRKVWFDEDYSGRRVTEFVEESSKPFVSETIEPMDDEHYSHVVHRKVELAPEVRKVTFTGPDADEQLRKFIEGFDEGEEVQETQEVDEYGNIHTKRVVQKRFIVRGDEGEQPMTKQDIEEYFRQLNEPEVVQDRGVITRGSAEAVFTQEISDGKSQTTITKKFEVPLSELTQLTRTMTGEEQQPSSQGESSSAKAESGDDQEKPEKGKSKKVPDQHQLSDEMKELLKQMEEESKQ